MPRYRKGYKSAARRYYSRRNAQARRKAGRSYRRKKKVSIKTIKKIATSVASRLDKKKSFKNWQYSTLGTYFNSDVAKGRPLSYLGIANRPQPYLIGLGSAGTDITVARLLAEEVGGDDLVQTLTHVRKSNKIYVTGITVKGMFSLNQQSGWEKVVWQLLEVKVPYRSTPTSTELGNLVNVDKFQPPGTGFIKPEQEQRELDKNTRVIARRVVGLYNLNCQTELGKSFVFNHTFKKPKLICYADDDEHGSYPLNRYFWHSFSCLGRHDSNTGIPGALSPMVCANVIMRYHEKLD